MVTRPRVPAATVRPAGRDAKATAERLAIILREALTAEFMLVKLFLRGANSKSSSVFRGA